MENSGLLWHHVIITLWDEAGHLYVALFRHWLQPLLPKLGISNQGPFLGEGHVCALIKASLCQEQRYATQWRGSEDVPPGLPALLRSFLREHSSNFKWRSPHSLVPQMVKNYLQFDPWVGKIPWRRKWLSTSVCLPREFHGQRSLATVHGVPSWTYWVTNTVTLVTFTSTICHYYTASVLIVDA